MKIPKGYKETVVGIIPVDWEVKPIGKVVKTTAIPYKYQTSEYLNEGDFPIVDQGKKDCVGFTNNEKNLIVDIPLVLFGDHTKIVKYLTYPFCVGADGTKLLKSDIVLTHYLFFGISMAINKLPDLSYSRHYSELKNISLAIPPLAEQRKIAELLSTWDEAITNCKKIFSELLKRKKWLAYNLLFNKKNNLVQLSKLVERVKNPFKPEPEKLYRQIGIRSHTKGIFYKEEVSGLSLGNKSVFNIEPNCFIVNIVFAWEHAIAKTTLNEVGMIASHRFPMYKPVEGKLDLDYLLHFFKSKKGKDLLNLASPGGAGRNKTLGQSEFLKLQIPVPDIKDQKHIAEVLDMADSEILLYQKKLKALQLQKKGLMQQLLTGKTRVN